MESIPDGFFKESWQSAGHPMAAVDTDNNFVRVNHAFERLLGYSSSELHRRSWMEFTRVEHIGGDMQSVNDVIAGVTDCYRLEKDYRHKRGHYVSIVLSVRRFPKASHLPLICFAVEAPIATATRPEIHDVERHVVEAVRVLEKKFEDFERRHGVNVHTGDQVGRNKTTNSDRSIWIMGGCLAMMAISFAWAMYYMATASNQQPPVPPAIQQSGGQPNG